MRLPVVFAFLCLFVYSNAYAQCPPNIGFENNSFENWTCDIGTINVAGVISWTPSTPLPDRHQIIDKNNAGLDRYGHFPTLCPNGSKHSVRLGDDYAVNKAERISYTYDVPAGAATTLKLNYALVLGKYSLHTNIQQPRFTLKLYNVTDDKPIICPGFDFIATAAAGFVPSDLKPGMGPNIYADVFYKDWSTAVLNLDGFQGKKIRLDFATSDCTEGEHLGYAYFDIDEECGSQSAVSGNVFCTGQSNITLHAPGGYDTYAWYKGTSIAGLPLGSAQNYVVTSPVDQDDYTLALGSNYGLCPETLHVKLIRMPTPFTMVVEDKLYGCPGSSVDLAAAIKTPGLDYSYHRDSNTLDYLPNPHAISKAGMYYIKGVSNPGGCTDIKPVEVIFLDAPVITVTTPLPVQYPATVDISTTHNTQNGISYTYFRDSNATEEVDKIITTSGTYYIKATAIASGGLTCAGVIKPVQVTITPPPPFTIVAPNAFTPNNDGVNDEFSIAISGYITFSNLKVFNRYGAQVFNAKSIGENWKGMNGNKQLPVGTYYWIFEGTDSYYKTPVRKGGWVTILR